MHRARWGLAATLVVAGTLPFAALTAPATASAVAPPPGRVIFDSVREGNQDLYSARSDGSDETRLTSMTSGEGFAALSSDAAHLAFASCRPEPLVGDTPCVVGSATPLPFDLEVFVTVPAPEGTTTRQLTSATADDYEPAISPNGTRIAFTSRRDITSAQIFTVPLGGGAETRLTTAGLTESTEPTWSPNDSRLAFVRGGRIMTLSAASAEGLGNQAVTVTTGTADSAPAYSPDGSRIAFVRNGDVYTVAAAGGAVTPVVTGAATDTDPVWSPDGSAIAVASNRDGDFDIYVHRLDGSAPTRVTSAAGDDRRPAWVDDLTLSASATAVSASPSSLPIDQVPLQAGAPRIQEAGLLDVPGLDLAPLNVPGLDLAPLNIPGLDLAPLNVPGLDLAGLLDVPGLDLAPLVQDALGAIHLSLLPLSHPAGGWEEVLAGTSLAGTPMQTITLGDLRQRQTTDAALAARLASVLPSHVLFADSPLGSVTVAALALGDTPLSAIDGGFDWASRVRALGFDYAGFGPSPSVLTLQLAGVPLDDATNPLPVHTIKLSAINLNAGPAPMLKAKLGTLDLASVIGGVRVNAIPTAARDTVVVCGPVDCSDASAATLLSALRAGGLRPTATVGNLGPAIGNLTVADLVMAVLRPAQYPLEDIPLERLGLERWMGPGSSSVTYTSRYSPVGVVATDGTVATFRMPAGFSVSSSDAKVNGAAVVPTVEKAADGTTVNVPLGSVAAGAPATVTVVARPSLVRDGTGTAATVTVASTGRAVDTRTGSVVRVVEAFEPNDTVATATPVAPGTVYVTHSNGGDTDLFKLPLVADRTYTVTLAHNSVDRDLAAYTVAPPETPLRAATAARPPIPAVLDDGAHLENRSDSLSANVAGDIDLLPDLPTVGVSANRGTSAEQVRFTADRPGTAILQVVGYLRAGGDAPYTLRITEDPAPTVPTCAPRTFAFDGAPLAGTDELTSRGTVPTAIPATTRTLILVNRDRLRDSYGEAAAASVMTKLTTFSVADRVKGTVIAIDGDDAVRAAEAAALSDPCSVAATNDMVRAVNNLVDRLRATSSADIDYVQIVGDDLQVPMARLRDRTVTGNERAYAANIAAASGGTGNSLLAAYARGYLVSDAAYGSFSPLPWLGGFVYRPGGDADDTVSVGRLLETPAEVTAQLDRFAASGGALTFGAGLTAGDDFMVDSATATDAALRLLAGATGSTLLTAGHTAATLHAALFPTAAPAPKEVALAIHGDHTRLQPADGAALYSTADLLSGGSLAGRLLWAISCHSGTPVADLLRPGASGATLARLTEWAQATSRGGASAFIGQTGFGLGLNHAIGLTEQLMVEFSKRLASGRSIGVAFEQARTAYMDGLGVYGVYDEKVIHQANLYGFPMIGDAGNPTTPAPGSGTGTVTEAIDFAPSIHQVPGTQGSYFQAGTEAPLAVHWRPLQPASRKSLGIRARGALIAGIDGFFERTNFNPQLAAPALAGTGERTEPHFADIRFPSTPLQVGVTGRTLVANLGSFRSTGRSGRDLVGKQRVFTKVRTVAGGPADPANPDFTPPRILNTSAVAVPGTLTVSADIRDATAASVVVLDGSGKWRVIDMALSGGVWKATIPVTGGSEYFIQSRDAAWNTAFSLNKGDDFIGLGGPPPASSTDRFTFVGPHPPSSIKEINAGSNIPFKFDVFENGVEIVDPAVVTAVSWYRTPCPGETVEVSDVGLGDPATVVRDGGQFKYGWNTPASWVNTCRAIQIGLSDGSAHATYYRFKA